VTVARIGCLLPALCARALVLSVLVGGAGAARADAVPPPPDDCPSGEVGTTDHSGPRCEKEAPTDCPAGWRGVQGGSCMLAPCDTDERCGAGQACIEHAVCLQPVPDDYYEYGEEPRDAGADEGAALPGFARGLIAGPMAPRVKRPKPIVRYEATNLCAADVACAAPRTCQTEKLCAPRGARAVAYRGTNVTPARVARQTGEPLTQSEARPSEATAPPAKGGCAACGVGASPSSSAWVLLVIGIAAAIARRAAGR
jgi:hypothetical protein